MLLQPTPDAWPASCSTDQQRGPVTIATGSAELARKGVGIWFDFPGATFSGNQVTFKLTDGGIGDADGVANGTIVEPGAPATTPVVVTPRFTG